jgi:hypothetical protein
MLVDDALLALLLLGEPDAEVEVCRPQNVYRVLRFPYCAAKWQDLVSD